MTIRFAAARKGHNPIVARLICPMLPLAPVNDNSFRHAQPIDDALRHFARHGLSAAKQASINAEAALGSGDTEGFDWWLSICRCFDRRMADALAARCKSRAS